VGIEKLEFSQPTDTGRQCIEIVVGTGYVNQTTKLAQGFRDSSEGIVVKLEILEGR
jgi:hypothetical protein